MIYLLINKRINQRFFSQSMSQKRHGYEFEGKGMEKDFLSNPQCGTIVTEKITGRGFDFYLCAQYVREGTCNATHYRVLYNTTNLTEDQVWQFTYFQCYNYFNWTGSVKVPGAVQYASKFAQFMEDHISKPIHKNVHCMPVYL